MSTARGYAGTVKTLTFYRIALGLPLAVPLLLLALDRSALGGVVILSAVFGGVQYLLFALVLGRWLGRVQGPARMDRALWRAPLLFLPVLAVGWLLFFAVQGDLGALYGALWMLPPMAIWCLALGYAYVGLARLACGVLRWAGWVRDATHALPQGV